MELGHGAWPRPTPVRNCAMELLNRKGVRFRRTGGSALSLLEILVFDALSQLRPVHLPIQDQRISQFQNRPIQIFGTSMRTRGPKFPATIRLQEKKKDRLLRA